MIASDANVSVIGIGNLGSALAEALRRSGRKVTIWNRTLSKCDALREKGALVAHSLTDAIASADVAIVCVTDHAAVRSLFFNNAAGKALRGKLLVQLSTISSGESLEVAAWTREVGASYLEGSIIGFSSDIIGGTATIVYAGPRALFDANLEVLAALGRDSRHIGQAYGTVASLTSVVYFFGYGVMISFIQGAAIASTKGIRVEDYASTILGRLPNYPRTLGWLGDLISRGSHDEVQASLRVHAAAFAKCLKTCRESGVDDRLPAALMHCIDQAIADGRGAEEISAVFEVLLPKAREVHA